MRRWGSVQYDKDHEEFHRLLTMDREEALTELGLKEFEVVSPDSLVQYTGLDLESDDEKEKKIAIKDFFQEVGDEAWDLWEAAGAAMQVFKNLPGGGYHFTTGQECFLLWISGALMLEQNPNEVFGGFCT